MKNVFLLFLGLFTPQFGNAELFHPGSGNWFEVGAGYHSSVYGYKVWTPYGVPHFVFGQLEIDQSTVSYYLFSNSWLKIGPTAEYVFAGYAGSEIDSLNGMSRDSYAQAGAIAQISLPFGQLSIATHLPFHENASSLNTRAAFATGVPAIPMLGITSWINIQLEAVLFSTQTSTYLFGVRETETKTNRPQHTPQQVLNMNAVIGHWLPLTRKLWLTTTYKKDWYPTHITDSPIVTKNFEETYLAGLLWSF